MTLEKLLIFGFGLAVVAALTAMATGITDSRVEQRDGYRDKVDEVVDRAK